MKKALVLSGGGTKGVYQAGALKALRELNRGHWDIITGTSVGALNAAMLVQGDFDAMDEMYENLEAEQIVNGYVPKDMSIRGLIRDRKNVLPVIGDYLKNDGLDITPFLEMVDHYYNPDRFFASPVDFGCITATKNGYKPVYVTKDMMREHGKDWLVASASAYPAFPVRTVEGVELVDGGYFDNSPIDFALRLGAEDITVIEMHEKVLHPGYLGREHINIIHPQEELFGLLEFEKEKLNRAKKLGYLDAMKACGIYAGIRYALIPFGIPREFDPWYLRVMLVENRCALETRLFSSDTVVTDCLRAESGKQFLSYVDYFFSALDLLMTIADLDQTRPWKVDEAVCLVKEFFSGPDAELSPGWARTKHFSGKSDNIQAFLGLLHREKEGGEETPLWNPRYAFEISLADFLNSVI